MPSSETRSRRAGRSKTQDQPSPTDDLTAAKPTLSATTASVQGASILALVQLVGRGLTFVLNQVFLLRLVSPVEFAAADALDLYAYTVLFFARDGVRTTVDRIRDRGVRRVERDEDHAQLAVNMAYLSLVAGAALSTIMAIGWIGKSDGSESGRAGLQSAIVAYGIAVVVEMAAEPAFATVPLEKLYPVRGRAEALAMIARAITVCTLFAVRSSGSSSAVSLTPFAAAQLVFAIVGTTAAWTIVWISGYKLPFPQSLGGKSPNNRWQLVTSSTIWLSIVLTGQSVAKYIASRGGSLVMAAVASTSDQAGFALAANYGSIIARLVFFPIEQTSRRLFSHLCAASIDPTTPDIDPGLSQAKSVLGAILTIYHLGSIAIIAIGPTISTLLLSLIVGSRWTGVADGPASLILRAYCYYIPLLAYNGITEAFITAVAPVGDLARQTAAMHVSFVLFIAVTIGLLGWKSDSALAHSIGMSDGIAIVLANATNMCVRLGWSIIWIKNYFHTRGLQFSILQHLPRTITITVAVASAAILRSERVFGSETTAIALGTRHLLVHLTAKAGFSAITVFAILVLERSRLLQLYHIFKT